MAHSRAEIQYSYQLGVFGVKTFLWNLFINYKYQLWRGNDDDDDDDDDDNNNNKNNNNNNIDNNNNNSKWFEKFWLGKRKK